MKNCTVEKLVLGMIETNVYFVKNTGSPEMFIVDPADSPELIFRKVEEMGGEPQAILLTHAHYDHFKAAREVRDHYRIPVFIGKNDEKMLEDSSLNLSGEWFKEDCLKADRLLEDGDQFTVAGLAVEVLFTPGHTAGSCCYYLPEEKVLLSGDTLFYGSYGRTDLATGSEADMEKSVRRLLAELPDDVTVCTGHGPATRIGFEKRYNPLA